MSKQFTIAVPSTASASTKNAVTTFADTKGWGFWHWIDTLWLLDGVPDAYTAKLLYDEMEASGLGSATILIFDMCAAAERSHWGRSKDEGWEWMSGRWGNPK